MQMKKEERKKLSWLRFSCLGEKSYDDHDDDRERKKKNEYELFVRAIRK